MMMSKKTVPDRKPSVSDLPMLEHLRVTFQRHRIQMSNRVAAIESERSALDASLINEYREMFEALEKDAAAKIAAAVKDHEMWPWLERVKGIGPGLAGCLVAHIDIEKAGTISALWRYAGQGVTEGVADRPTKGVKLPYNKNLQRVCFLIGTSFLRSHSPYVREYAEAKTFYQTQRDWTPAHIDMAARRKMVKLFLSHFWTEWRKVRSLEVRQPYAMQILNHDGFKAADDYLLEA